jgi:hypothetical protein
MSARVPGEEPVKAMGEWQEEALCHASLMPAEYRALVPRAGFEVIDHLVEARHLAAARSGQPASRADEIRRR